MLSPRLAPQEINGEIQQRGLLQCEDPNEFISVSVFYQVSTTMVFLRVILILIFAEALGLYGLIVGLVVASTAEGKGKNLCSSYA